ncbi:MAG: hypothetical protein COB61_001300 [Thiotrichales bacterium]|nr:hypothetical protein [Thiotrichales bacterium]
MALPKGDAAELALHFDNEKHGRGEGVLHYRAFSQSARVSRAILLLVYCWLVAVVTIPIPILHLIAVPGFFIGGIILFVQQLRSKTHVESALGQCPVHVAEVDIPLEHHMWPPVWVHCPECKASLHLVADVGHQELEDKID